MDLDISKITKLVVLVAILAVFAVGGWRLGAPGDFHQTLADAGLAQQAPAPSSPQDGGSADGH